jgi:hypothetical protein
VTEKSFHLQIQKIMTGIWSKSVFIPRTRNCSACNERKLSHILCKLPFTFYLPEMFLTCHVNAKKLHSNKYKLIKPYLIFENGLNNISHYNCTSICSKAATQSVVQKSSAVHYNYETEKNI